MEPAPMEHSHGARTEGPLLTTPSIRTRLAAGGLVLADWRTPNKQKLALLASVAGTPVGTHEARQGHGKHATRHDA